MVDRILRVRRCGWRGRSETRWSGKISVLVFGNWEKRRAYITRRGLCNIGLEFMICQTDFDSVCLCWR
jgi:hypothetical protein